MRGEIRELEKLLPGYGGGRPTTLEVVDDNDQEDKNEEGSKKDKKNVLFTHFYKLYFYSYIHTYTKEKERLCI